MQNEQIDAPHVHQDPWLAPHLVDAFFASCEQGAFVSTCEVFAQCGAVALFLSPMTNQYGVGIISSTDPQRVMDCYQYPSRAMAVLRFLEQIADPTQPIQ
jgi:hypothetical protein